MVTNRPAARSAPFNSSGCPAFNRRWAVLSSRFICRHFFKAWRFFFPFKPFIISSRVGISVPNALVEAGCCPICFFWLGSLGGLGGGILSKARSHFDLLYREVKFNCALKLLSCEFSMIFPWAIANRLAPIQL